MNLTLKMYQPEDLTLYAQLSKDIRVMRYITEKAETESEAFENFEKILAYNKTHNDSTGYYKIFHQDAYIGFGKLSWDEEKKIEIGYMICPDYWGQGYATQLVTDLLEKVKQSTELFQSTVYAVIDPENRASKCVLEKHAFVAIWQGMEDGLPCEHLIWQPSDEGSSENR